MMIALLLAVAAPPLEDKVELSPEVRAVLAERGSLTEAAFVEKFQVLADRDDASAIEMMGELYTFGGFGVTPDATKACALFTRAATRRGDSAHNLARCYEFGAGEPLDFVKARQWYGRAASVGYLKSNCALGLLMIAGKGGAKDAKGGIALCRKAAEAGDPDAQTDLGNSLLMGENISKNVVEARKWYSLAAARGQANAAFVLAQIYRNGDGTPVDLVAAERWWRVAYDGGRKDAAGFIAQLMFKRMQIVRDGKEAIDRSLVPDYVTWVQRAAEEDPDPAVRKIFADSLAILMGEKK